MPGDDRIRCAECRWLSQDRKRICLVAEKRKAQFADGHRLKGDHPWWTYRPHLEIRRRCEFGQRRDARIDGKAP